MKISAESQLGIKVLTDESEQHMVMATAALHFVLLMKEQDPERTDLKEARELLGLWAHLHGLRGGFLLEPNDHP